jgi:hypothetical protein
MFTIQITEKVDLSIKKYVDLYTDYFQELYTDTWIWAEDTIQKNYKVSGKKLFQSIYDIIQEKLSQEILPYSILGNDVRTATLTLWNRRIALEYSESGTVRTITDIKIWYKH